MSALGSWLALDANCMVAFVSSWHQHQESTAKALTTVPPSELIIPAQALLEAFSVLTRLPQPHRASIADAWSSLRSSFVEKATVVESTSKDVVAAVEACSRLGRAEGKVYDALIVETAARAGARELWTWNVRDLERLAPAGLAVRTPDRGILQ